MRRIWIATAITALLCASAQARPLHHHRHVRHHHYMHVVDGSTEFLPHPAGCPRTAFCGCGSAKRAQMDGPLALPERLLWLAANWLHFPRAEPSPGMAAVVGRHHVFVIERLVSRTTAIVYDANSGGHETRRHLRSIAGAVIVDPHRSS